MTIGIRSLKRIYREADITAWFGILVAAVLVLMAVFAPWIAPHDPTEQALANRLVPPVWEEGGQSEFLLGTDNLGRDVLSRMIWSTRTSVGLGIVAVGLAALVGISLGLASGYIGGRVDSVIMRVVDTQAAFPGLLLMLLILAAIGPSATTLVIMLSLMVWMVFARMTRGMVLSIREDSYVEAAELVGCKTRRTMFRHILPNLLAPLLTLTILEFARIVLAEAALSFLGLGIQPPDMSWGLDIATGRGYIFSAWWLITVPGIALSLTVLGLNLLANWIRSMTDPQERERRFARSIVDAGGAR